MRFRMWVSLLGLCAVLSGHAAGAEVPSFQHELWGRTSYGDGYVYGPPYRSTGVTVVDIDEDSDYDFVLPSLIGKPQVMRNLGNDRAFYPGGPKTLDVPDPAAGVFLSQYMDFADLTGDGLPDLVVVGRDYAHDKSSIYYYKNNGPRNNPAFVAAAQPLYRSPQAGMALGALDLTDLDGDGKVDLCFVEFTMVPASAAPKLYFMKNTTTSNLQFATPVEITALSNLLPAPRLVKKSEEKELNVWKNPRLEARTRPKAGEQYQDVVTDMEFGDWDSDGDLDFMFYNSEIGVQWVLCVDGAAGVQNRWDTVLDRFITPYRHGSFYEHVEGSFAVRPGPGLAEYPDFYVSVEGVLETWRYNSKGGVYELVQQNATAFDAGTGPAAFWDYDGDGDLDMFRTAYVDGWSPLLLIRNVGTPYSAIWDWAEPLEYANAVYIDPGSPADQYRQELYTFCDADGDGDTEFFLQDFDGRVLIFTTTQGSALSYPGFFYLIDVEGVTQPIVPLDVTDVQPRGIAVADFNGSGDGVAEVITCYSGIRNGSIYARIVYLEQVGTGYILWMNPIDVPLLDENGQDLNPDLIESLAAGDVNGDGRIDLVVTLSTDIYYRICTHHVYLNTDYGATFGFEYAGEIDGPRLNDNGWARMVTLADIDADSDPDLFLGHQYYDPSQPNPEFNRYPYQNFYRNESETGLGFWQTRVVSGQQWTFTVGGEPVQVQWVSNTSGGIIDGSGLYTAGPNSGVVDIIETVGSDPIYRIYIDVLPQVGAESKAILVVGGKYDDPLYPVFEFLASQAYNALLLQGITADNIRLLDGNPNFDADLDGVPDVYGAPILANLGPSITQWASGANRLLVYLVDHGQRDRFRLNATEYLSAAQYDAWLDTLQTSNPLCVVTTVIDTCEAGSFLDNLKVAAKDRKAGVNRITLTSSNTGPTQGIALFDGERGISFSLPFWEEIRNGATYGKAFSAAKVAIESINPLQSPQIDDNGNGIGNETSDGLLADTSRPGADFALAAPGVFIGEVAPPQAIGSNAATLWLSDVVAGFPVEAAGALIIPPNLTRPTASDDDEQPLGADIEWIDFDYNDTAKRWEGSYGGFNKGGLYRIQYYVQVLGNFHASPRIGFVDRVNTPDPWEPDGTFAGAPWLTINFVQGHNFHQSGDVDWARFMAPPDSTATIAVLAPGPRCQPVVELYRASDLDANPLAAPLVRHEASGPGQDVVFERSFTTSELYYVRVSNKDGAVFGEGTSYLLMAAVGTGSTGIQNILVVTVRENGTEVPLSAAAVKVSGGGSTFNGKTTASGDVQFICRNGQQYTINVQKSGYLAGSGTINVNNIIENLEVRLTPEAVPTVTLNLSANRPDVPVNFDGTPLALPQAFTVQVNSVHSASVPTQLNGGFVFDRWSDGVTTATRSINVATSNLSIEARYKSATAPRTDISGDGGTDAIDVQLVVNGVLGVALPPGMDSDVNGDGSTDAIDVQLVVNAVLGL